MNSAVLTPRDTIKSLCTYACIIFAGIFIAYKIVHIPLQLELVLLITTILFYPLIRQPSTGIYLIFIIMPFIPFIRRLYYLLHQRPSIDPLIALGDIITSLTFIGLFFTFKAQKDKPTGNHRLIQRIILIYLCYLVLRVFLFNSLPVYDALMKFRFYGPAVLLFFLGILFAKNTHLIRNLWILTLGIGVIAALYGFKQLFIGYSESEKLWFSSISFTTLFIKGFARPFSFFQSPASFADYMQLSIIGVVILYSWRKTQLRVVLLPFIALFFYGSLITSVRSNWIGILISLFLWFTILQVHDNRKRVAILGFAAITFFFVQLLDSTGGSGINSLFSLLGGGFNQQQMSLLITERSSAIANPFDEYSFLARVNLWRFIFDLSFDPVMALFGRGVGVLNADSLYFTYLAEFGYPGLIFIVWFTVILIIKGFTIIDRNESDHITALAKGVTLMNIVFAVVNMTGTHIHSFPGDAYFWFWNGVLVVHAYRSRTSSDLAGSLSLRILHNRVKQ